MKKILIAAFTIIIIGCTKKLDLKPESSITLLKTTRDLERLLDNTGIMNITPALAQLSADEYFIPTKEDWQSQFWLTSRNAAIWEKDIYGGLTNIPDWKESYTAIFYSNSVLDVLANQSIESDQEKRVLKGWALFARAYAHYSLLSLFAKPYEAGTSKTDLGIPLKLSSAIEEIVPRSTVEGSYNQIIKDATEAANLLQQDIIKGKRTRPSKVAAYAFLARVYLSMRSYPEAMAYADQALLLHAKLINYNTFNPAATITFNYDSEETIYFSQSTLVYEELVGTVNSYGVDPALISMYDPADLRLSIYYRKNSLGNYCVRSINSLTSIPFTGIATDEVMLIKAECLARGGQVQEAMDVLNSLLRSRWKNGVAYVDLTATNVADAIEIILTERRKSLVWRNVRWTDLKRLNLEGRNINISRKIGNDTYQLPANSPKYILPIPDDEIALSGVIQNIR